MGDGWAVAKDRPWRSPCYKYHFGTKGNDIMPNCGRKAYKMFDVLNQNNAVISSHEHLWQAALVLLEENCKAGQVINANNVAEVDRATNRTIRIIPPAECKEALSKVMTPKQIADIQRRHSRP